MRWIIFAVIVFFIFRALFIDENKKENRKALKKGIISFNKNLNEKVNQMYEHSEKKRKEGEEKLERFLDKIEKETGVRPTYDPDENFIKSIEKKLEDRYKN